jgi:uncharacterized membrane protein
MNVDRGPVRRSIRREPRWHAAVAVVGALLLYITLPPKLTIGPVWIAPLLVLLVSIPLFYFAPRRAADNRRVRILGLLSIAIVNFFNVASIVLLIAAFFHPVRAKSLNSAGILLRNGAQIWLINVLVFGLWFWELDGGGPAIRERDAAILGSHRPDFLFPQMQLNEQNAACAYDPHWTPAFFDYLYIAFTNATAFSPADVLPLTRRAKAAMLIEAMVSLATIAIVLSRSVSLIE